MRTKYGFNTVFYIDEKTQQLDEETLSLLLNVNQCVNTEITLSMLTNPNVYSRTQYQHWFRQNTGSLREEASYLGWGSPGSIHTCLWWTKKQNIRFNNQVKVLEWFVAYTLTRHKTQWQYRRRRPKKLKSAHTCGLVRVCHLCLWPGWKSTGHAGILRGRGTPSYRGLRTTYNNSS